MILSLTNFHIAKLWCIPDGKQSAVIPNNSFNAFFSIVTMSSYIIIPAYNEAKNLLPVVKKARKYGCVVVVDDGSTDETNKVLQSVKGITLLTHAINLGKGAALKTGYDYALKCGAQKIIMLDSDGQHDTKDIPKFERALENYDAVFGYRYSRGTMPLVLRLGNWGLSKFTSILFRINIRDSQCGYRGFTAEAYKKVRWLSCDFDADNEMIANTGAKGLKYTEIPINTLYLDKYKGTTVISGLKIGWRMLLMKLRDH